MRDKGLGIFILFFIIAILGGVVAIFTLGLGLVLAAINFLLDLWQVLDVKKTADDYNTAVKMNGRPPW